MSKFAKELTNKINLKYIYTFFRRYVVVNPNQAMVEVGCNDKEYMVRHQNYIFWPFD